MTAVLVFAAMALLDFCWGCYIRAMAQEAGTRAGVWSAVIVLLGATVTIAYVQEPWMVVPAALGAFVGTRAAIWLGGV